MIESDSQLLFLLLSYFKRDYFQTLNYFAFIQVKPIGLIRNFLQNPIFILETSFITGLKHCVEY
jgi:hypothetical protein